MSLVMKLDNFDGNLSYGEQFMLVYAIEALTANNWVAFVAGNTDNPGADPYLSVQTADSGDADGREGICGVVTQTTTAAGMVQVQIAGRRTSVNVASTVVAGEQLVASATAGRAQDINQINPTSDADALEYRVCGVAVTTASSNTSTVDIYKHPRWGQG